MRGYEARIRGYTSSYCTYWVRTSNESTKLAKNPQPIKRDSIGSKSSSESKPEDEVPQDEPPTNRSLEPRVPNYGTHKRVVPDSGSNLPKEGPETPLSSAPRKKRTNKKPQDWMRLVGSKITKTDLEKGGY